MPRTTAQPKEENFNFRVSSELKTAFKAATGAEDRPAAQVLRDFMRAYVRESRLSPEAGHDAWFRKQVQAAMDDPRPSVPHDVAMKRTHALIERMVRKNARS